jgi:O-antigen/teichoic acid export membrane protein
MWNKLKSILSAEGDLKEIVTKSSVAMLLRIIGMATNYLFLTFVIFKFGSEGWGIFAICFSILQFSSMFGTLGVDIAIVKLYASNKIDKIRLFKYSVAYVLPMNILLTIIIFFCADWIGMFFKDVDNISTYIKYTALGILPFSFSLLIAGAYRGLKKIATYTFFDSLGRFTFGLLFVFIISLFIDSDEITIIGFVIGLYVLLLISLFTFIKTLKTYRSENGILNDSYTAKELLRFSLSLFWNPIANRGISWTTIFMLSYYVSKSDVGVYDTCFRLASLLFIVQFAINSISAPKFAEFSNSQDLTQLKKVVRYITKFTFMAVTPIFIALLLTSPWLLQFFGDEFLEHYYTFLFIVIGQFIGTLGSSVGLFMQMTGFHIGYRNILFIVLLFNGVLGLLLIPNYGIEGGALVISFTVVLRNIFGVIYVYKKTGIRLFYIPFIDK